MMMGGQAKIINKQQPVNNNLMMKNMVPNGPLMQRGIRNQQAGGLPGAMVPQQRHQVAQVNKHNWIRVTCIRMNLF